MCLPIAAIWVQVADTQHDNQQTWMSVRIPLAMPGVASSDEIEIPSELHTTAMITEITEYDKQTRNQKKKKSRRITR
eukprot:4057599-Amphidinium_carterae.2